MTDLVGICALFLFAFLALFLVSFVRVRGSSYARLEFYGRRRLSLLKVPPVTAGRVVFGVASGFIEG